MATAPLRFEQVRVEFEKVVSFLSEVDWIEVAKQQPDETGRTIDENKQQNG